MFYFFFKSKKMSKRKDKYDGFKVPSTKGPAATKCVTYIYQMIKEANPKLLNEDVKKAFNNFVECLLRYDTLYSWTGRKYRDGIKIVENNEKTCIINLKSINCRFNYDNDYNTESKNKLIAESCDVLNHYIPLYDLIKRDVVPYMEIKQWEITSKFEIERYHKAIEREEKTIIYFEKAIETARKAMCEYAEKAVALQSPPETTTF